MWLNDVVIDVGAHFGFFTILMADLVGSNGQVHSFEPIPSTLKVLKKNADSFQNIQINNEAVWRNSDQLYLNDYGLNASAFNSYRDSRGLSNKEKKRVKVNAINLDEYIKNKNISPTFIKIDSESTEYEVLEGMKFSAVCADIMHMYRIYCSIVEYSVLSMHFHFCESITNLATST